MPPALTLAPDPDLGSLPWAESGLTVVSRAAENGDQAALAPAFAGIAETGTLMLLSGPESPTTLNFLPDAHLVVLAADRIVGPFEDAWDRLRRSRGDLPRTVNFITGPSRSGDIEQTLQMGAHGPVDLHILLVGDRSGDSARAATDGRDRDSS
jgi:L-lactate dehydrogenase complex protein LldG